MCLRVTILIPLLVVAAVIRAQQPQLVLPIGHTDRVTSARFSPDGQFVITGGKDKEVKIWQTQTGKLIRNFPVAEKEVYDAFFSNDQRYVIVQSDSMINLWSLIDGKVLARYENTANVIFSPDSKEFFLYDFAGTVTQVSIQRLKKVRSYPFKIKQEPQFNKVPRRIDVNASGELLCIAGDSSYTIWNTKTGKQLFHEAVDEPIASCYFTSDKYSLMIVTPSVIKKVSLSDFSVSKLGSGATRTWLSNNRNFLLTVAGDFNDSDAHLRNANTGDEISNRFNELSIYDTIQVYDSTGDEFKIATGTIATPFPRRLLALTPSAAVSNDGKFIRVQNEIWNNEDASLMDSLNGLSYSIKMSDISPDSKYALLQFITGEISLWSLNENRIVTKYQTRADQIKTVALSPDGERMLVTGYGKTAKLINTKTGKAEFLLEGHNDIIVNADFSADGKTIVTNSMDSTARTWDARTGEQLNVFNGYHAEINPAYFAGNKLQFPKAVFDSFEIPDLVDLNISETKVLVRTIQLPDYLTEWVSPTGRYRFVYKEFGAVYISDSAGTNSTSFISWDGGIPAFSPDEKWVAIGYGYPDSLMVWDLENHKWLYQGNSGLGMSPSKGPLGPRQMAFTSDRRFLLCSDGIEFVNVLSTKDYKKIARLRGRQFATSENGKYVVTVDKGVCHVYFTSQWRLLYSYISVGNSDQLTVDPFKRYDGTANARSLLYYSCGNEALDLAQFKDLLWVPNLTERIMRGDSINAKRLEDLKICGLTPETEQKDRDASAYIFSINPRSGGLGETVLYVNGIEARRYKPEQLKKVERGYELIVPKTELASFFVSGTENIVSIKSYTADNNISSRGLKVRETQNALKATIPNLYAVMVGVSDYKGEELDLKYAAKDATDISNAVSDAAKKLLNTDGVDHVFMYNLTTSNERYKLPEKLAIKRIFEEVGKKATANDILMIFFAGHGVMDPVKNKFYFLTAEASTLSSTATLGEVGISTLELTEWIKPQNMKAQKRIMIFDACNSGQAIKDFVKVGNDNQGYVAARNDDKSREVKAIDKLNEQSGLFILSASASNQSAYELGRYSQGLLTYSLLKAIKQQPDILEDGKYLNVSRWFNAAERTVTELAKENGARQQPQVISNTNFNIGIIDGDVVAKINLPEERALFTSSIFLNNDESISDDDLDLSRTTNLQLSSLSARGTANSIIYVSSSNSPDAWSLSGKYTVQGNVVTVKVNVRQNRVIKHRFELMGTSDKIDQLATLIVERATGLLK